MDLGIFKVGSAHTRLIEAVVVVAFFRIVIFKHERVESWALIILKRIGLKIVVLLDIWGVGNLLFFIVKAEWLASKNVEFFMNEHLVYINWNICIIEVDVVSWQDFSTFLHSYN